MKVFFETFMWLQFGSLIICQKEIDAKSDSKMLVKLNTGVNFTNILWADFLRKSVFEKLLCAYSFGL